MIKKEVIHVFEKDKRFIITETEDGTEIQFMSKSSSLIIYIRSFNGWELSIGCKEIGIASVHLKDIKSISIDEGTVLFRTTINDFWICLDNLLEYEEEEEND